MRKLVAHVVALVLVSLLGHTAEAQQPKNIPRLGYLSLQSLAADSLRVEGFRQGLRDLGYIEGKTIAIEWRWAMAKPELLADLAQELVRLKVDIIVTAGTPPTQAAMNATKTIPIVMQSVTDPVGTGLVASLAHPGGNVTGLSNVFQDLGGKQLELLKEAFPKISRVAILWEPANAGNAAWLGEMKVAADTLRITVQSLEVRGPDDFEPAFSAIKRERAGGLIVVRNAITNTYRTRIMDFAAKSRLPAMYPDRVFVEDGGLMSYGSNLIDLSRRAATYVDKILKGTKPADLPVEQPMKFELVINLKAAKQIGVTIPQSVLYRADKVIK